MGAEALRRRRRLVAPGSSELSAGNTPASSPRSSEDEPVELPRIERFEVLVERVDDETERKLSLELRGAATEGKAAAPLGLTNELEQQQSCRSPARL